MNAVGEYEIKGSFEISVLDAKGNPVKNKQLKCNNAVMDYARRWFIGTNYQYGYWNPIGADYNHNNGYRCQVGTGTTAYTPTSPGFTAALATSDNVKPGDNNNHYSNVTRTANGDGTETVKIAPQFAFAIGTFSGQSLSEVGLTLTDGTTLIAAQLITDEFGNPTTITVLSDEQLVITYTLELVIPMADHIVGTGTVDVNGTPVGYTVYGRRWLRYGPTSTNNTGMTPSKDLDECAFFNSANGLIHDSFDVTVTGISNTKGTTRQLTKLFAPSDFASDDIKTIQFGNQSQYFHTSSNSQANWYVVFDTPLVKTSSDAFSFDITVGASFT